MSGIAVIVNLDGRPVEPARLDAMLNAIAHRGPDGFGRWLGSGAALGHAMLVTVPEQTREQQPHSDESGDLHLVLDGRVDDRDELRDAIESAGIRIRDDTDAELVLRAFQVWRHDAPRRILGDFAFAVWDLRRRELFCARDQSGIRPFYYYCDGRTFIAGSELQEVLRDPMVPREPNEGLVGEYLTGNLYTRTETLYRDVSRLPAAHGIVANASGVRMRQYFDLNPRRRIRYRDAREYGEHFFQIFREAVRCRLRADRQIVAELSGGLDSSSIVSTMRSIIDNGAASPSVAGLLSLTYDQPALDEREYYLAVAEKSGFTHHMVPPYRVDLKSALVASSQTLEWPNYPSGSEFISIVDTAARSGARALLSGLGGDQWLSGSELYYAELLAGLRIPAFIRELREDPRLGSKSLKEKMWTGLWYGIRPMTPLSIRNAIRIAVGPGLFPPYINCDFANRIGLRARVRTFAPFPRGTSFSQRTIYGEWVHGWMAHAIEITNAMYGRAAVEPRYPFYDLRVIEFCLAIPEEQRFGERQSKRVLREAMRGVLPEIVRTRRSKAEFNPTALGFFERIGGHSFFEDLAIARHGWVDQKTITHIARTRLASPKGQNLWHLLNTFAIEVWFRANFEPNAIPASEPAIREVTV